MKHKLKKLVAIAAVIFYMAISAVFQVHGIDTMLRVAFKPSLPPYQFEENGEYVGMHIDILDSIAQKNNFLIEYIPMETTNECMKALDGGEVDIVLGYIANNNSKYKSQFTDDISQSSICVIAPDEKAENIKNKASSGHFITGFEKGTIEYSFMQNMESLNYIVAPDQIRTFELLVDKKADMVVGVKSSMLYQLEKCGIKDSYTMVYNYMAPIAYNMVIRRGDQDLMSKLNSGLQQLRISGEYEKILNSWLVDENDFNLREITKKVIYAAAVISCIIAVVIIFNVRLNVLLKKQVEEKTKELKEANGNLEYQIVETRNNSELKNRIVENSPSGIVVFDNRYNITLYNQSACKILKIDEPAIGKSVFSIELLEEIFKSKTEDVLIKGHKYQNEEITRKDQYGENVSYRYSIYQLYDNSNIRGAILTIDDVTQEVHMKEEIFQKEKNRVLNQIIAGIAHEIRNPLMSIKTFAQLIPTKKDSIQFQEVFADLVPRETERINNLINNLIDYSKPAKSNKEKLYIKELIDYCTLLLKPILENKSIKLSVSVDDGLYITADKDQIKQVLINIILNASEAMKEKLNGMDMDVVDVKLGMDINAWKDEKHVYIRVTDEGIGMTPDQIKKSKEPFFTTKANGTGLGLSVTTQYIEENEGVLLIESKKNEFTKVTIKFGR